MSPEFQGSSKHEPSKLYSLEPSTIKGFAERTENQILLEKFLHIVAERALAEEFNTELDDLAVFLMQKLQTLQERDREDTLNMETRVKQLTDKDYKEARQFFEVFPYYYQEDDPTIAQLEREHEALFKRR